MFSFANFKNPMLRGPLKEGECIPYTTLQMVLENPINEKEFKTMHSNSKGHVKYRDKDPSRDHQGEKVRENVKEYYEEYDDFKKDNWYLYSSRKAIAMDHEKISIDRILPQHGYYKDNIRFTTLAAQACNKWNSVVFYAVDQTQNMAYMSNSMQNFAKDHNIPFNSVSNCLSDRGRNTYGNFRFVRIENEKIVNKEDGTCFYCYKPEEAKLFKNQNVINECY